METQLMEPTPIRARVNSFITMNLRDIHVTLIYVSKEVVKVLFHLNGERTKAG